MPKSKVAKAAGKRFKVALNGSFLPIKAYVGGDLLVPKGSSRRRRRSSRKRRILRKKVSTLTLTTSIHSASKTLSLAAHKVANQGKNERFTIRIYEQTKAGRTLKTYTYHDCLLTSLDYPTMSAHGGEILQETATFKPQRVSVS